MVSGNTITCHLSGGGPWGFRLIGGEGFPLEIAKVSVLLSNYQYVVFFLADFRQLYAVVSSSSVAKVQYKLNFLSQGSFESRENISKLKP